MQPVAKPTGQVVAMPLASEVGGGLTVAPQTFGEVIAFAEQMAKSSFVPMHLRGKPADCMAVCLQALRWGMDPFAVGQKTYFTRDGSPPGYEAQLIAAVVHARAPLEGRLGIEWAGTWPKRTCTVTGKLRGDAKPKARTVEAERITTRNSPLWKTDPDQQLAYYTIRAWARLYTPDTIMGVYGRDELAAEAVSAENARDVTPERPSPATKLDALEEIIGPNPDHFAEAPTAAPEHDAITGEILPPAGAEPAYDPAAVFDALWAEAQEIHDAAVLNGWWKGHYDDQVKMHAAAPDLYADLDTKVKTLHRGLKHGARP